MTQATKPSALPAFEGNPVASAALRITKTGDGLSEALELGPKLWHLDEEIFLVAKVKVTQVNHRVLKDGEPLSRVHTATMLEATEVNETDIGLFLANARERIREARDEAKGQESLLDGKDEPKARELRKGDLRVESDEYMDPNDIPF
jgi:hypothetical protein